MRIFLSYSSEDRDRVEPVYFALRAQGHTVFFDRADLPAGEEYDVRIRRAIEKSHLFMFMVSPDALDAGSYTLTELAIAKSTWPHPARRVLPVVLRRVPVESMPAYLKAVTLLEPEGNLAAGVADAVHRLAQQRRRIFMKRGLAAAASAALISAGAYLYQSTRQVPTVARPAVDNAGKQEAIVTVAAGKFTMGDDEESPLREVYLDGFQIDKYEVTVSRYAAFLKTGGAAPPDHWEEMSLAAAGNLPVVGVSWHDAQAYCRWVEMRLPTEAEWERAARGRDGRPYPWGDDAPAPEHANFGRTSTSPYANGGLAPVGSYEQGQSADGAYDLAGNAAEWVADWFAAGFVRGETRNPKGPADGTAKVIRGGGWHDPPERLRAAKRMYARPDSRADDTGFRCARDLPR